MRSCVVGMDYVTSKFNKYDLSEIWAEYLSKADPNHSVPPLPKYVGGSEVYLFDEQISSTQSVLGRGGFGFKYVVNSGRAPGEKASPDGIHVKLLGYKWNLELDVLYPGFAELNLNKKV